MLGILAMSFLPKGFAAPFPIAPDAKRYFRSVPSSTEFELVETATGKVEKRLTGARFPSYTVLFAPDGRTVAECSLFGEVCVWSVDSGERVLHAVDADAKAGFVIPLTIRYSPDGRTLAIGNLRSSPRSRTTIEPAKVSLWDVTSGKRLFESSLKLGGEVREIRFAHGGRTLRAATSSMTDFDARSGQIEGPKGVILAQDLSEDGRLAFASIPGWIHVADADTGRVLLHIKDPGTSGIQHVRFSPDDRNFVVSRNRLVTSGDTGYTVTTFEMWRLRDGHRLWTSGESGFGDRLCFSPDGRKILLSNGEVRDVDSGRVEARAKPSSRIVLNAQGVPFLAKGD